MLSTINYNILCLPCKLRFQAGFIWVFRSKFCFVVSSTVLYFKSLSLALADTTIFLARATIATIGFLPLAIKILYQSPNALCDLLAARAAK